MFKFDLQNLALIVLASLLLTSCSTKQSSPPPTTTASIDASKLPGYKKLVGSDDFYFCDKHPSCPNHTIAVYKATPATAGTRAALSDVERNPGLARSQFELVFGLAGVNGISPVGDPQSISAAGIKGVGMRIEGQKPDGSPKDPQYMIMLLGSNQMHMFVGISKTKPEAKNAAMKIANALVIQ